MKFSFFHKLKYLLGITSDPGWVESLDYRGRLNNPTTPLTVKEVHAALTSVIERGHGDRPLLVKLAYIEGQLCGEPLAKVAVVEDETASPWGGSRVILQPDMTLIHIDKSSFKEMLKLDSTLGPYT